MHGIEGNDAVRDIEFAEQLLRGGDFVGLFLDIDVRQDQTGFDVEGVQHLGRLAIVEIVEASSECLAIDRDDASRRIGMALHRPAACWRKTCSTAWGSRP